MTNVADHHSSINFVQLNCLAHAHVEFIIGRVSMLYFFSVLVYFLIAFSLSLRHLIRTLL